MKLYTTSPGESVSGIALRELGNAARWGEIRELNSARFPDVCSYDYYPPGTELCLPEKTEECNCDQALELKNTVEELKKVLTATNKVMQLVIDGNKEALEKFKP